MGSKNKTSETSIDAVDFINAYAENDQKKTDSLQLMKLMTKWSGFKPKMW